MAAFAKATGEYAALSTADIKLIALAYTLEASLYGQDSLAHEPAPPRVHSRQAASAQRLPGWGVKGGDWAELDRLAELELAPRPAMSGIATYVSWLTAAAFQYLQWQRSFGRQAGYPCI